MLSGRVKLGYKGYRVDIFNAFGMCSSVFLKVNTLQYKTYQVVKEHQQRYEGLL